ncbi:hypothetical protein KKE34_01100 [Patescibacteria group bacterium]|nr:hypothetical protein [Patescibacteria group bacterium]MBU1885185.1 hypothetical protein [Patescibacteria group bacterium]
MSNDQPSAILLTPAILVVSPLANQKKIAISFLNSQLSWKFSPNSLQLRWLNQEQNKISIEMIRDLIGELAYAAHMGKSRAFIFLYSEQISIAAQHALLKSLEEPPVNTQLILITSLPSQFLPTIRSRCLTYYYQSTNELPINITLPEILEALFSNPKSVNYHQLVDLANEYKDREQAIALIQQSLITLHNQQQTTSKNRQIQLQTILLRTLQNLKANVNVCLALEHCFFTIKK